MKTTTAPSPAATARYWNRLLAPYMEADDRLALFQLLSTLGLFALGWVAMLWSLEISYGLTLLLAVPMAGLLVRCFIFQHDCGHGAFLKSRRANNAVGFFLGVLMLTPYDYWRRTHAIHHGTSGDLDRRGFGDIRTLTVREYLARSPGRRFAYRLYRSSVVLLLVAPFYQFVLKHRFPFDAPFGWKREWASVWWTNLAILAVVLLAWQTIGLGSFLAIYLPIMLIAGTLGIWLFYVQHQFEDTYWRENPDWDFHRAGLEGSSLYDLPRWLHWFTGNIGFHHIHHLSSRIPNYYLPRCFRERPELQKVTRLGLWESLRCARLKLWDEEAQKMIGFRELRASSAPAV